MTDELARTPEDRRHHLDMIQAVISRMADSGAETKRWTLTIAGAAFGVSALNGMWYLSLLGVVIVVAFSIVNMNYLHQEHLFIALFRAATRDEVTPYEMNKNRYENEVCTRWETYRSWSVLGFYGVFMAAGLAAMLIGLFAGPAKDDHDHHRHRGGQQQHLYHWHDQDD